MDDAHLDLLDVTPKIGGDTTKGELRDTEGLYFSTGYRLLWHYFQGSQ